MKKNLNLFLLLGACLLVLLNFAFMALPGWHASAGSLSVSYSVYSLLGDVTVALLAFIFGLVALLAVAFAVVVELKVVNFKYVSFCVCGAAVLLLTAGILSFFTASGSGFDLGAGAVLVAISDILAALLAGFVAMTSLLKK